MVVHIIAAVILYRFPVPPLLTTNYSLEVGAGLFNEHHLKDMAVFHGNNARVYFLQSKMPYYMDATNEGQIHGVITTMAM